MKYLLIFILIISSYSFSAQKEPTSFYFGEAQPKAIQSVQQFDAEICGNYVLEEDSLTQLVITKDSIYMQQSILFTLTKKDFKKSKGKYYIKDNLLFGIVNNEGIPYLQENDTTYAIYKQTNNYYTPSLKTPLKKQNKTYFLNEQLDNNYFSSSLLFSFGKGIAIYSLDHEEVMPKIYNFNQLDSLQLNDFKTYIAYPTLPEMNQFVQKKGFNDAVIFFKPNYYIAKD